MSIFYKLKYQKVIDVEEKITAHELTYLKKHDSIEGFLKGFRMCRKINENKEVKKWEVTEMDGTELQRGLDKQILRLGVEKYHEAGNGESYDGQIEVRPKR